MRDDTNDYLNSVSFTTPDTVSNSYNNSPPLYEGNIGTSNHDKNDVSRTDKQKTKTDPFPLESIVNSTKSQAHDYDEGKIINVKTYRLYKRGI